ncbi:hypothetical protein Agub_g12229, partial [Astrephomene gubernaculifera]
STIAETFCYFHKLLGGVTGMESRFATFDDVLDAYVGHFGRGQLLTLLIASISHIAMATVLMLMVFTAQDPFIAGDWLCVTPSSSTGTSPPAFPAATTLTATIFTTFTTYNSTTASSSSPPLSSVPALQLASSLPSSAAAAATCSSILAAIKPTTSTINPSSASSSLSSSSLSSSTPASLRAAFCALPPGTIRWTRSETSLLSYYNLTCGREWLVTLLNSLYFVGLAAGGLGFGALSDRYGRKACMYGCTALGLVATVGEALAPAFWLHALCRVVG